MKFVLDLTLSFGSGSSESAESAINSKQMMKFVRLIVLRSFR